MPKWNKESLAFRQAILAARSDADDEDAQVKASAIQKTLRAAGDTDSSTTKCPHCGRTFNEEAGERHIAICVKTFGSKPGGGRLIKGGGRHAVVAKETPTPTASSQLRATPSLTPTLMATPSATPQPTPTGRAGGAAPLLGGPSRTPSYAGPCGGNPTAVTRSSSRGGASMPGGHPIHSARLLPSGAQYR